MSDFKFALPRFILLVSSIFLYTAAIPPANELTNDVLKYTNEYRRSKGLSRLIMKDDLNALAHRHSEDMSAGRTTFGHNGFEKRSAKVKKMYNTCYVAENVAYGAGNAKDAVSLWKNSSGHRKNMLGNFKYIGVGTAKNKRGVIYYTAIFVN